MFDHSEFAALFRAVLLSACEDMSHVGTCTHRAGCPRCCLRRDVIAWLHGAPAPFSFEDVCTALNLDPDSTRRAMFAFSCRFVERGESWGGLPDLD